jgi:peroxiredoxin
MVELGELEKHHTDFDQRNVRIISVSPDNLEDSKKTQDAFPHLQVVSDAELNMADALAVRDKKNKGHHGQETNSPTTILVDKTGTVRWVYRADRFLTRLSPEELLKAVDEHLPTKIARQ